MDDLIKDFLVEAAEALQKLDNELVILEREPQNQELLGSIFRIMHTIKGTCGFLGLSRLESIAHAGENILGKIRDGELEVTQTIISVILESIDAIKSIIAGLEQQGSEPEGQDKDLIEKINKAAIGKGSSKEADKSLNQQVNSNENINNIAKTTEEQTADLKKQAIEIGLKSVEKDKNAETANSKINPSHAQSVRVNLDVLEGLMLMVSELVLTRNQLLQIARAQKDTEFSGPIQRLGHITTELQERVMKTRMQPIGSAWAPFPRLVRDLAHELGKKIELKMIGEETELDRQLIESIKDPLTHMVRNSADHGLESCEERIKSKKTENGTITLKAYHQGGHIIIEVSDNGRGLNADKIKAKVLSEGLATESELAAMSDQQIYQYIFKAGFSTASKITSVSGRGVGMDVVKTNIEKINGTIELSTKAGKGTSFMIKIPLTLAIMSVLIVECAGEKFAIPQINVLELVRAGGNAEYMIENINDKPVLRLRNSLLTLAYLSDILGLSKHEHVTNEVTDVVVCEIGGYHFGIIVDRVYDTEEIVVKPVAPILKSIDLYSGITLLGDGSVIMILDPNGISRWISSSDSVQNSGSASDHIDHSNKSEQSAKFLLVHAGKGSTKAIPLEIVSRLEEIDVSAIEFSGKRQVVQYRDKLMYLTKLNDEYEISEKTQHVVSFIDHDKILGIMVEKISDIVENKMEIVSCLENEGYLGSIVINGKTSDLVDVPYFFEKIFGEEDEQKLNDEEKLKLPRVLLIDDSTFFRKIIPQDLLVHGYETVTVETADKAISLLEKDSNFVTIVTDYQMPGMTGEEFANYCLKDPELSKIPLIMLSSGLDRYKKSEKLTNIKAYISKTNHDSLFDMIDELAKINKPGNKHEEVK